EHFGTAEPLSRPRPGRYGDRVHFNHAIAHDLYRYVVRTADVVIVLEAIDDLVHHDVPARAVEVADVLDVVLPGAHVASPAGELAGHFGQHVGLELIEQRVERIAM